MPVVYHYFLYLRSLSDKLLADIKPGTLHPTSERSWCEWKGEARYYDVLVSGQRAQKAAWYYPNPVSEYAEIKNYVAFYANKMEACFVDNERVDAQAGSFYGGWITANIQGPFKGGPGTAGW